MTNLFKTAAAGVVLADLRAKVRMLDRYHGMVAYNEVVALIEEAVG